MSTLGLAPGDLPRDGAFCQHTIQQHDVFSVGDAAGDPRFANDPLVVGEAQARAYAGAPLRSSTGPTGF